MSHKVSDLHLYAIKANGTASVMLRSPLPCSIRNFDNPDGICGRPATVAYAWQQEPGGEWATPGLWVVQPVCRQCAEAAAKVYKVYEE